MRQGGRFGRRRFAIGAASVAASALSAAAAWGQEPYGHPEPGQIGFQAPVTDLARYLQWFHNDILMPMIVAISLFVLALLIYVVWRFNENVNPTPSRTTHNAVLEVAWTIVPVIILVFIAVPSFRLADDATDAAAAGRDDQGDGVAMALELRLSQGRRRLLLRFVHEGRQAT